MIKLEDVKDKTPNAALIERMESLLKDAKAGELRSFIGVVCYDDCSVNRTWAFDERSSLRMMLAELLMLQHDMTASIGIREGDSVLAINLRE